MKILIVGSNGQLGNDFKKIFSDLNINYLALDKDSLDITDYNALEQFFIDNNDIDIIINCAAYNNVDMAEKEKNKCIMINEIAPYNLAKFSKKINAIFVTYSTDFVFDGDSITPYTEIDKPNPLSTYGISKYEGEKKVINTHDKFFIIRTSWVFGIANNNFVKQIIEWSKTKTELNVVDDQVSSPTYSKDLALLSWELIKTKKYGLYHISSNGIASKYDQSKYVLDRIGWKGTLVKAETSDFNLPATRPKYSKLDSSKVESILGEKIPCWKDAIDRFLVEMKENKEL